jgi:hypothetical protein
MLYRRYAGRISQLSEHQTSARQADYTPEKEHVLNEMLRLMVALQEDRVLTKIEKEQLIVIAVCSVFRYSAGVVAWTDLSWIKITSVWAQGYESAWSLPTSMDNSPFVLSQSDGGQGCPSATELWIREVLGMLEQCVSLPGEISQVVTHHLQQQCTINGCYALNQPQRLLCVGGNADLVVELFLSRFGWTRSANL